MGQKHENIMKRNEMETILKESGYTNIQFYHAFPDYKYTETILIEDEVLAVEDLDFQKKCYDVLNEFKNEGVTIVFVSHDLYSVKNTVIELCY